MLGWFLRKVNKVLRFLTSRLVFFSLLIVLQVVIYATILIYLSSNSVWVFAGFYLISLFVVIYIVSNEDNPSYKIAWIILVLSLSIFGGIIYMELGNKKISRKRKRNFRDYTTQNAALYQPEPAALDQVAKYSDHYTTQANYIYNTSGFGPAANTTVDFCPLGEDQFAVMLEEIPKAKKFIFMEYFIIQPGKMWDSILALLKDRAAAGVEIRLMYDDLGCIQTLPDGYHRLLEQAGIHVTIFNPFRPSADPYMNYRDHRKICVIDGLVGICGGINLADEYINAYEKHGHWKDTAVVLRGDGVWSLTRMFLQEWGYATKTPQPDFEKYRVHNPVESSGFVQPYPDTPLDHHQVAENVYLQIINRADDYIYITTPYLILDNEFATALKMSAESGVDVRIITPHIPDKWYVHSVTRSYYTQLLRSGVRIYEYTPGFIHAKMFVSDDCCAVVGTANLDYRSLYLHHECAVTIVDHPAVAVVKADVLDTLELCQEISFQQMQKRSLPARFLSAALRIFAPLM